jgi:hypothetical protein
MEQQPEISEVLGDFDKEKAGSRQDLCPHCQNPLQTEEPRYASNYWQWNDKTRKYEREEPAPNTGEPFCPACRAEYRDALYK